MIRTSCLIAFLWLALAPAPPASAAAAKRAAKAPSLSARVGSVGEFSRWIAHQPALQRLAVAPARLGSIVGQAGQVIGASPRPVTAVINERKGTLELASGQLKVSIPLSNEHAPAPAPALAPLVEALSRAKTPQAVEAAINGFYDRSNSAGISAPAAGASAGASPSAIGLLNPNAADAAVSGPGLQEQLRQAADWLASPRRTVVIAHSQPVESDKVIEMGPINEKFEARAIAKILDALDPNVNVIYVTSHKAAPEMIQQVVESRGIGSGFLERVRVFSLDDDGPEMLAEKLLRNPQKLAELKSLIDGFGAPAGYIPFMTLGPDWKASQALDAAFYSSHPSLDALNTKSGNRKVFRAAGLPLAYGFEDIYTETSLIEAIEAIWTKTKAAHVMVKLNEGSTGRGNAKLELPAWKDSREDRLAAIAEAVQTMTFYTGRGWEHFRSWIPRLGAIAEEFVAGPLPSHSPSGQAEVLPDGSVRLLSTHDQILDGSNFIGADFPAASQRELIQEMTLKVGKELASKGVLGRFAVDYLALPQLDGSTRLYPIEINIRTGATTNPYEAAVRLTGARFDPSKGLLIKPDGKPLYYRAIDNDGRPGLKGMAVKDFWEFFRTGAGRGIKFDPAKGAGVLFHFLNTVPTRGRIGYTIMAESMADVEAIHRQLGAFLDELARSHGTSSKRLPAAFNWYFLRSMLDQFGSWTGAVILPLYAFEAIAPSISVWGQIGLYAALVVGAWIGADWAKRFDSRVTFAAEGAIAAVALSMIVTGVALGLPAGALAAVYVLARTLNGLGGGATLGVAEKDIIPRIVGTDPDLLARANGLFAIAKKASGFAAPALAAFLVPFLGYQPLLIAAAALLFLSIPPTFAFKLLPAVKAAETGGDTAGAKGPTRAELAAYAFLTFIELGFFGLLGPFIGLAAFDAPVMLPFGFELSAKTLPGLLVGLFSFGSLAVAAAHAAPERWQKALRRRAPRAVNWVFEWDRRTWLRAAVGAAIAFLGASVALGSPWASLASVMVLGAMVMGALIRWTSFLQSAGGSPSIFRNTFYAASLALLAALLLLNANGIVLGFSIEDGLRILSAAAAAAGLGVLFMNRKQ